MVVGSWQWMAHGKHPSAHDFFTIGETRPVFRAFSSWVDEGVKLLAASRKELTASWFYRFWAKGTGGKQLLCGIVRSSCDHLGRPYPLLVMGSGPVDGWEQHWELLNSGLERTYQRLEYLVAGRQESLDSLRHALLKLEPPVVHWDEIWKAETVGLEPPAIPGQESGTPEKTALDQEGLLVLFPVKNEGDSISWINDQCRMVKDRLQFIPTAVFMGGGLHQSCLAFFNRPLVPADFFRLWSWSLPEEP